MTTREHLKEKMRKRLREWIESQYKTAGWEQKLERFLDQVVDDCVDAAFKAVEIERCCPEYKTCLETQISEFDRKKAAFNQDT